jgi:tRNA U34 5-carboxymethylaminomethyl modifying GTPase MnmE/TrmE
MGSAESAPRRITMGNDDVNGISISVGDMAGISVTEAVIDRLGKLPLERGCDLAPDGRGLKLVIKSENPYFDKNRAVAALEGSKMEFLSAVEEEDNFPERFTALEIVCEDELVHREEVEKDEEERALKTEYERVVREEGLLEEKEELKAALENLEKEYQERLAQALKNIEDQAKLDSTNERLEHEYADRIKQRDELKEHATVLEKLK